MPVHVSSRDPHAVAAVVQAAYAEMFPEGDPLFVSRVFGWAVQAFRGELPGYQPADTGYHDLEHTLQETLCFARLLLNWHRAGSEPRLTRRCFELGLVAVLFHDTGYLKRSGDTEGTGAKYTLVHVRRSAEFARVFLEGRGYPEEDIRAVENMILCTGADAEPAQLPFGDESERLVGCALGTADVLAQMAAEDYLEKLPALYEEFAEAAAYVRDPESYVASYRSSEDLLRRTPSFWTDWARPRLEREFRGLYRYLSDPYPDGPNEYLERIEAHMERLRQRFGGGSGGGQG
ncbi:hypothetical protein G4L39_04060 [Limisphaera ngatamarikiensis]|uniref:HD domain-containing protein n=1 Tax=Limisphaera ngatamarikiensis TaxID=1324935 RepID=A0A6M1RPI9_9BACT|nr:hypothetical protein [Limisphaera ngatamarikiensis]NGO38575.1 hypothetical protein [Limisphaera ngatamarikiensis]